MNTHRSVSRYGTSGRMADWVSARTLWAASTPAAPSVATLAAPLPFMVRLFENGGENVGHGSGGMSPRRAA